MNSSTGLFSTESLPTLFTREYFIRTKLSRGSISDYKKILSLRIFDDSNRTSELILLKNSERNDSSSSKTKNIDSFLIQTERKLGDTIQKLKLHASNISNSPSDNDENQRIFLKWIELTDLITKHTFCFPVDDYLPSSPGDALELTEVHKDTLCEENKLFKATDELKSSPVTQIPSTTDNSSETEQISKENRSNYAKLYDVRTRTGRIGIFNSNSALKANVYLKLYDTNYQSSESIPLIKSTLHRQPFRPHQTDQFEIGTKTKLGQLQIAEIWHDGIEHTGIICPSVQITDQSNGEIYYFQIDSSSSINPIRMCIYRKIPVEHLNSNTKLVLTDYSDQRSNKTHLDPKTKSETDPTSADGSSVLSKPIQENKQALQSTQKKPSSTVASSAASSNSDLNQTLFKIRTKVGHKGFLSLGMGGTDAKVYMCLHQDDNVSNDILLNNSLAHKNPFEAGHTDVFEVNVPNDITSPDKVEIFHNGKKHDGVFLKWIEIMNMNTLERKCFPIQQWLDSNEGDRKTHRILTDFVRDQSCEEVEYRNRHGSDQYKTEYVVRTKTSSNQSSNNSDSSANIYLKIYNDKKKHTEDMLLSHSKHRSNPFQAGKIDKFDVGSVQLMDDHIDKIELWHDNKSDFNWFCEWIEIKNKKTGSITCFGVNRLLSRKSSDGATKIPLTIQSNHPCEKIEHELRDLAKNIPVDDRHVTQQRSIKPDYKKKYIIKTKTGNKLLAGTDADVYVRLYDDQNQQSEDILLEQSLTNKHRFEKHQIDEFHTGTLKNLSDLQKVRLWHTGGKNHGWHVKWLQIEDVDAQHLYCFPVNKWLDLNSGEKSTEVILTEFTIDEPCSTMYNLNDQEKLYESSGLQSRINGDDNESSPFKRTYHVETKTGKRGFLGLSPTGTNANVYMRIHDQDGQTSESIVLQKSTKHRNKFERGQTDEFDVGSSRSLNGIDKIELWHDGAGLGRGWFVDYVAVRDNKTNEETCFSVGQYLNDEYGGVNDKHLILDKQTENDRPCREHFLDGNQSKGTDSLTREDPPVPYKQKYLIETKTGHTGLFGLGGAGTDAPVYIRIHDNNDDVSESIRLAKSLRHKNKFERNQTDQFAVGTYQNLNGVKKIDLWHEGSKNDGWQIDYINVIDKKTGDSYCFVVNAMLDKNSGLKTTDILLENPSINVPCRDQFERVKTTTPNPKSTNTTGSEKSEQIQRNFTIRTKTGNQLEAGSTTPIHIQLYDDKQQESEDIRLKHKEHDKHNFEPGAIDQFQVTSSQPLSDQLVGIRVKHKAPKYQGWYAEWIEITDEDHKKTYCFPIQRWIDKAENDKQRNIYFSETSDVPCDSLPDTMPQTDRQTPLLNQKTPTDGTSTLASQSQASTQVPSIPFKSTYHVKTKTGKKGFLGLSPTGTNAKVFMRVIDKNGETSEDIQLARSTDHKNKFERGQTDEFDVGSSKELNGIDQIDLWTTGKGVGSGWYPKYIEITDNKSNDVACFPINQYLNRKNGGIEDNPLRLKRISGDRPCQELVEEMEGKDQDSEVEEEGTLTKIKPSNTNRKFENTYSVTTKTGHTGFLGLGAAGTNARVYIRIHDTKGKLSEPIRLKHSTRHSNKFERNQTDQFNIGTIEPLVGVSRLELWHEGNKNDGWQVEYIQLYDNQTNTSYCFPVNAMLDKNSGLKQTHVLLERPLIDKSCPEQTEALKRERINTEMTSTKKKKEQYQRNFTIRTKTGNQIEAGSTAPIHVQLFDDQDQSSEDIRLLRKDHNIHNFVPGAIDEFQVTSEQPLSNQLSGIRVKHHADKYQGWFCEWIEVTDNDSRQTYCYPVQRWIDKAENDKKTDVFFSETSNVPCDSLQDSIIESNRRTIPIARKTPKTESSASPASSKTPAIPFQNTYHVETKTGKKGFFGLSPTGTNAGVFIQIIDHDGNKSEAIELKKSTDHKDKFERDKIDQFDVGSTKSLNGIQQLEIWTNGKGLGHGWYADYVLIRDNKTNEEACFLIEQYLNKEHGGVSDNHLIVDKQTDDLPCRKKLRRLEDDIDTTQTRQINAMKSNEDLTSAVPFKRTYHVDTKTGEKGFLGLSPTGTNANVYLRIYDKSGRVSEPIRLHRSTKHSNPFEKGNIDSFDIGTKESLESIEKIELYHSTNGIGHGWNVEYVNILDNTNEHNYCFPANKWIHNTEHLILENYHLDQSCEQINQEENQSTTNRNNQGKRSFTVRTKTGAHVEAGSTTPIYLRLYDDHSQKSEKIRLKQNNQDNHHFQPGSIDEFQITSDKPLNTIETIKISHKADKYQGWYGEWISITDNDQNQTYCFPLQRWLDKGELDGKTEIYLKRQTDVSCDDLPETMQRQSLRSNVAMEKTGNTDLKNDYKSNYRVKVKTAKKGVLGLAPTGTDANVFLRIHDKNGTISESIHLKDSLNQKDKFARGQIDEFEIGSIEDLNGIDKVELWTDGKGLGSGWYPDYIQMRDKKTGENNCFLVEQYLNEKHGGSKDQPLILNKQKDDRLCEENIQTQNQLEEHDHSTSTNQERFQVDIKTGHTGFLKLGGSGVADASVSLRIYDTDGRKSDDLQLKHSTRHRHKFQRNQTDRFLLRTNESLVDVSQIDLIYKGNTSDDWQVDYINIIDRKTDKSYCFPVNSMLEKNSRSEPTIVHLENPSIDAFCKEQAEALKKSRSYTSVSKRHKPDKLTRNYTVRTKTGNDPTAGSTTPIHLQLIDINDKKSKHIQLKKKDMDGHHFAPGTIDEFQVVSHQALSTLKAIKLSLDAHKHQGWYGEWISITDDENQITYCFPIQRWLDKGEDDQKTHITLYQQSNVPCEQIQSTMNHLSNENQDEKFDQSKFQFEISIQTADKSLKGKFQRDANVYLNFYDKTNQPIEQAIRLEDSKIHQIPFQRHHLDKFYLNLSNLNLSDIVRLDLYHDGENDGWFADSVKIKNIQTNEKKCFSVHQWLDQVSDKTHFSMTNYEQVRCDDQ